MKPHFKKKSVCEPAVDVVLAGLKASFSHADLRRIVVELQKHLSPEVTSSYPREAPKANLG